MRYNGFEYNFSARLPRGITLFGGGMSERMLTNTCDDGWNPNLLLYCDQSQSGIPFRTQFKVAGSIPVKYGVQVGVAFQSLPGVPVRHDGAIRADRRVGPERHHHEQPAGRRGIGVADHPYLHLLREQPVRGTGQVRCGTGDRSGHDAGVAVGAAGGADDRVRRPHQSARRQHREDVQGQPHQRFSRRSISSTC